MPEGDDAGEIWIRGANMFSGYWPDGDGGPDEDGWWGTGDVGFLDASGDLFLVDRLKELVIVSGFNVYPSEVEDVIREVPSVADAAVIGVEDARTGEAVVAYVHPAGGESPEAVTDAVREHCAVAAGEVQAAVADRGRRRAAADGHRQGAEGPAARDGTTSSAGAPGMSDPRVTLYSRPGCHLCDDARVVVQQVCAELGESYVEVSIDGDPDLQRRFGEEIPVTFVDGRQHDFWRVDPTRLRTALS